MKPIIGSQQLARQFNQDEAVWVRYQQNRLLRRIKGSQALFPKKILDNLDWRKAEQECRERYYVGKMIG